MKPLNLILSLSVVIGLSLAVQITNADELTERDDNVNRDSSVGDHDDLGADAVDPAAGTLSKTFTPPGTRKFREFTAEEKVNAAAEEMIDLILSEGWTKDSVTEAATSIAVSLTTGDFANANDYPITADGNLKGGGGGSGGTGGVAKLHWAAQVQAYTIELEINNTPDQEDDLLRVRCHRPEKVYPVEARIRLVNGDALPSDLDVTIRQASGSLRFSDDAAPDVGDFEYFINLTLPRTGDWQSFHIAGWLGSPAMNDAWVVVEVDDEAVLEEDVTVFWFDEAQLDINVGGAYTVAGGQLTAVPPPTVDYEMSARIRPTGVPCAQPAVKDLRIGLLQNLMETERVSTFDSPTIAWEPGVAVGTTYQAPPEVNQNLIIAGPVNDSAAGVDPLYDQPGVPGVSIDFHNSLAIPIGCAGGGTATTSDTPSNPILPSISLEARDAEGVLLGEVTWSNHVRTTMDDSFVAWVVVYDPTTDCVCPLRQRAWGYDVASDGGLGQTATVGFLASITTTPEVDPPFINTVANDPANLSYTGQGAICTFTNPDAAPTH